MNILEGDAFEVKEAMKNEVEVWRWSIKLDFEGEEMVKTSELIKLCWRNPEVMKVEVDDNWKWRNLELKFEVKAIVADEIWS